MIEPVAPAKAVEPPAPLLEKRDHLRERVERLHAVARVIAAARICPARGALLPARAERDDLGLALPPPGESKFPGSAYLESPPPRPARGGAPLTAPGGVATRRTPHPSAH